ncbi:MAG TPA: GntR family transcriptional regulator, partial [Candidatus Limnocylindria bacterium]
MRSIEEVVTTALRDAILSGELRPGERLLQEQLADQLRVSRIPLRDALRRLEA